MTPEEIKKKNLERMREILDTKKMATNMHNKFKKNHKSMKGNKIIENTIRITKDCNGSDVPPEELL